VIVLGVETSTARSSVAVLVDGVVAATEHHEDARGHGAFLAPAVRRCLEVVGGPSALGAIGVGTGPGLYTGLRVGMATAAALASARGLPVVGVGGLDVLARMAGPHGGAVVTTLDARRGQVFWAVHEDGHGSRIGSHHGVQPDGQPDVQPDVQHGAQVGSQEELDAVVAALRELGPVLVVGEIGAGTVLRPDAATLAELAAERIGDSGPEERLRRFTPAALSAVYLRDADVRIGWNERGGVRAGGPA
jgi:tRNA threonylcarbamoyladenosine biosynthesis protein TsaB